MSKQTLQVGGFGKKTARVFGPLAVIMGFLPTVVFAQTVDYCNSVFGVSTTTGCTYQVVDYPVLDFWLGIVLFLMVVGWVARYFSAQIHG